jgi:4-hydroxy-tetrahydrodipicolinate synthase
VKGVFAAVATPLDDNGRMNVGVFERLIEFLLGAGVHGICLGGATSEYPRTDPADRRDAIAVAAHLFDLACKAGSTKGCDEYRRVQAIIEGRSPRAPDAP